MTVEEIYDVAQVIAELEPRPGRDYVTEEPRYIVPDVYVTKVGDKYYVQANDDGMPRLKISGFYRAVTARPPLVASAVFIIAFGAAVGLTTTNLGTLSRYRLPMMPPYAAILFILSRREARTATTRSSVVLSAGQRALARATARRDAERGISS